MPLVVHVAVVPSMGRVAIHWRQAFAKRGYKFVHIGPHESGPAAQAAFFASAAKGTGVEPSSQAGGVREMLHVMCVTLDWMLDFWPAPSVVKIDVEAAETAVPRGATCMLAHVRPKILCEVSAANRDQVSTVFRAASYAMHEAEAPLLGSAGITQCAWNTIARPAGANHHAPGSP